MKVWRKAISNEIIVTSVTQSLPSSLLSRPVAYSDKNDDDDDDVVTTTTKMTSNFESLGSLSNYDDDHNDDFKKKKQ